MLHYKKTIFIRVLPNIKENISYSHTRYSVGGLCHSDTSTALRFNLCGFEKVDNVIACDEKRALHVETRNLNFLNRSDSIHFLIRNALYPILQTLLGE